jgi:diguanylate cyclase (GGDEF)-like protein
MYGLLAASSLLIVLLIEAGMHYARLAQLSAELSVANGALEQLSLHDGLTGLPNRRFFDTYLAAQIGAARRYKRRLALVLCDIDSFKPYNDHYGHQAGDECLKEVAAALRSCCRRPGDMAARYGGEEFALILPDTDLNGAARIAEAARDAVAELRIPHAHSLVAPYVSISGGVAILLANNDAEQLITAADQTLFLAKKSGRAVARLNIAHAHSPAASYVSISGGVAALLGKGDRTAQQLIAEPTKACSRRSTRAAIGWFLNRPRWHEAVVRAVRDEGR